MPGQLLNSNRLEVMSDITFKLSREECLDFTHHGFFPFTFYLINLITLIGITMGKI